MKDDALKKLDFAILFTEGYQGSNFTLLEPDRVLLGKYYRNREVFEDFTSGLIYEQLFSNTSFNERFGYKISFKKLNEKYKRSSIKSALENYIIDVGSEFIHYKDASGKVQIVLYEEYMDLLKRGILIEKYEEEVVDSASKKVVTTTNKEVVKDKKVLLPKISEIDSLIKETVIAQDEAIKETLVAIYKAALCSDEKIKSNILIYGPSGVGKTEIVRLIGKHLQIPVLIEDMTMYTAQGYIGASVDEIFSKLYRNANNNLQLAQRSILVLDEIDKKASNNEESSGVNKDDVTKSLLKIIEGGKYEFSTGSKFGNEKLIFDTKNLIIIACGAFENLKETETVKSLGFGNSISEEKELDLAESFIDYGIPREFIGRFSAFIKVNQLTKDDFINILTNSKRNSLEVNIDILEKLGWSVDYSNQLLDYIADRALKYKTGARALGVVVDKIFQDILYEVFDQVEGEKHIYLDDVVKKLVKN